MSRPCWYIGLALLLGCLVGAWLPMNVLLIVAIGSIICLCVTAAVKPLRRRGWMLAALGWCVALISLLVVQWTRYLPLLQQTDRTLTLQAQVSESDSGVYLTVTDGDLPKGTRLQLWSYESIAPLEPYDTISGTFVLCDYGEQGLSLLQRKASGVWAAVKPEEAQSLADTPPKTVLFSEWRHTVIGRINRRMTGDSAALTAGICFGADSALSEEAQNAFRVSGISHLFSVSGFHMALLSQALLWLLERMRCPRFLRATVTAGLLLLFMALVGTEPSVVRSGILCLLMLLSTCFRRQADTRNSLGLALILLLTADPFAAYDVGLLLSFFATFGLVLLCPRLSGALKRAVPSAFREHFPRLSTACDRVIGAISLTISATLATLPITLLYFGEFSVVSVLSNLLSSLPSSLLLVFGLIGCLCVGPVGELFAEILFLFAGWIAEYLLWIAEKISNFPFVTVAITDLYLLLWMVGTVLLLYSGYRFSRRAGLKLAAATAAVSLVMAVSLHTLLMHDVTRIDVFATQGDVAVCIQHNGQTILFCAPERANTVYRVRTGLRLSGVRRIDVLIVPHADDTVLAEMVKQMETVFADTRLLYGEELEWVSASFAQAQPLPSEGAVLAEEATLDRYGAHFHFAAGETDVLLCNAGDSVRLLPKSLWYSELVLYEEDVPQDALLLQAERGIAQGNRHYLPSAGECGVEQLLAVNNEGITVMTRGAGDITIR